jgi:hypothetical protein
MAKTKKELLLRVRLNPKFRKEMDDYLASVNERKVANQLDRSTLVREAVLSYMANNPVKAVV